MHAQAKLIEDSMATEKDDIGYIDPEPYADGKGGAHMYKVWGEKPAIPAGRPPPVIFYCFVKVKLS